MNLIAKMSLKLKIKNLKSQLKIESYFTFLTIIIIFTLTSLTLNLGTAQAALVPCSGSDCNWCSLLKLGKNLIDFMMYIAFPLAAGVIVYGGFFIMISRDKPDYMNKGKKAVGAAVIGLIIALLAWVIIDTILKIAAPNFNASSIGPWNQLQCQ